MGTQKRKQLAAGKAEFSVTGDYREQRSNSRSTPGPAVSPQVHARDFAQGARTRRERPGAKGRALKGKGRRSSASSSSLTRSPSASTSSPPSLPARYPRTSARAPAAQRPRPAPPRPHSPPAAAARAPRTARQPRAPLAPAGGSPLSAGRVGRRGGGARPGGRRCLLGRTGPSRGGASLSH